MGHAISPCFRVGLFPRSGPPGQRAAPCDGEQLMGRYVFRLPDIGEGVAEAEIVAGHVQPGDSVKEDGSLVDVMTDKVTVDMTSPVDGVVTAIHGDVGSMLPVGSVLIELKVEGPGNADE